MDDNGNTSAWMDDLAELIKRKKEENEVLKKVHDSFSHPAHENDSFGEPQDVSPDKQSENTNQY